MTVTIVVIAALVVLGAVLFFLVGPPRRARRRGAPPPESGRAVAEAREAAAQAPAPTPAEAPARARVEGLGSRIRALFAGGAPTGDTWKDLEDVLVRADVGPRAAERIVERVREGFESAADPVDVLADEIAGALGNGTQLHLERGELTVLMVVGVNGAGKTTTIGKLAAMLGREGMKVSLANSDTFRAAAAEQLTVWADRAGAHLVAQSRGADPGAVAYDAVQAARARGSDVLVVDTAGRLHTRQPLMDELAKVKRVLEKAAGDVEEVLLVLDATTGQNGIQQARVFTEAVQVTGIVLTKMDGTAKGGIVLAVREELGVPVKFIGTGETLDDLEPFDPKLFADRLVRR
ncbi:MAG: signal recognition particle-docking protein FtsY [Actinomycetota bacterium]|nr:signal recognition particle-docking protein FtsY [Actinomycetota bacterium]